jgi:hypothetical protein
MISVSTARPNARFQLGDAHSSGFMLDKQLLKKSAISHKRGSDEHNQATAESH